MSKIEFLKIKDLATVYSGTTPDTKNSENFSGEINWYTPAEIDAKNLEYVFHSQRKITEEARIKKNIPLLPRNTVLLTSRAPIGKVAIAGSEFCTNQGFKNIVCDENKVNPKYLAYWLFCKTEFLNSLGRGATFKEVSKKIVEEIEIPVPSLEIQNKVVKVLEKINGVIEKRQSQITALDELTQSLFLEMFGDPLINPRGWNKVMLGELTNFITYGLTRRPKYVENGIPLISAKEIRNGYIDFNNAPMISNDDFEALTEKCKPIKGEILFSKTGTIGSCTTIESEQVFAVSQNAARISIKEDIVNRIWLLHYLKNPKVQKYIDSLAKGNAVRDLQIQDMKKIPIYLPEKELQDLFINKCLIIKNNRDKISLAHEVLINMNNALLQKAFKGELFQEQ